MEIHHLAGIMTAAGIVLMVSATVVARHISSFIPDTMRGPWRSVSALIYFFLAGYLLFIFVLFRFPKLPGYMVDLVAGTVFLGGALFVFIILKVCRASLVSLGDRERKLRLAIEEQQESYNALDREVQVRKMAEQEVLESRSEWENTFNSIDEAITVHDLDYNILLANKAAEKLLGDPVQEREGAKCFRAYHGTEAPPQHCPSCRVLKTKAPFESELYEPHLDRYLHIRALPRQDSSGRMVGVIHVVRDVTARKKSEDDHRKLEERFIQAQKMETVGRLAGGVAHDFNNLISIIMNYSEVLASQLDKDHRGRRYLETIVDTTERAGDLVRQLLAFSRRQVLKMRSFDLAAMVGEMMPLWQRTLSEDIALDVRTDEGPVPVFADRGQIEQVLLNLVVNAKDAMPLGGRMTVETGIVAPTEEFLREHTGMEPGSYASLRVTDSGEGMSPEVRGRIFEPFFTTKELGSGTGLGLATVYGIMKQHRGCVYTDSVVGEGTTFTVLLPLVVQGGAVEKKRVRAHPGGSETILLVDDEALVLDSTREFLESLGYRVYTASSGEAALSLLEEMEGGVDLLLTDVVMKGMDGRELSERVQEAQVKPRILFMSGYTDDKLGAFEIDAGKFQLIDKPLAPAILAARIRAVLDDRPPPSSPPGILHE